MEHFSTTVANTEVKYGEVYGVDNSPVYGAVVYGGSNMEAPYTENFRRNRKKKFTFSSKLALLISAKLFGEEVPT